MQNGEQDISHEMNFVYDPSTSQLRVLFDGKEVFKQDGVQTQDQDIVHYVEDKFNKFIALLQGTIKKIRKKKKKEKQKQAERKKIISNLREF